MTDRDRLIYLIVNADVHDSYECKVCTRKDISCVRCDAEKFADYLLANGVSVLPFPIGSTVYEIRARGRRTIMWSSRKCDYSIINDGYFENAKAHDLEFYVREKSFVKADCSRWNKTVFATKEEAEKMLKELTNESQNK